MMNIAAMLRIRHGIFNSATPRHVVVFIMFILSCGFVFVSLRARNQQGSLDALLRKHSDNSETQQQQEEDLVIVPGHAIFIGDASTTNPSLPEYWIASDFIKPLTPRLAQHVAKAASIPSKLLVFSGGFTSSVVKKSEAMGYLDIAKSLELLRVDAKVAVEEHSRDSFENLLFSLCVYRREMGTYPSRVTVVGFDFKRRRFSQEHAHALGIPQFTYVGMDPDLTPLNEPMELSTTIPLFQQTPFGCGGTQPNPLTVKRSKRNPYHRILPAKDWCPEITNIFSYCPVRDGKSGTVTNKRARLPWEVT